jgi:hypothetical protein
MGRPTRVPERGDVSRSIIALRLGLALPDFNLQLPELEKRGFPLADPTTGHYCIEAVDRWRLRRHAKLFPELMHSPTAIDAGSVFAERMERLRGAN